MPNDQPKASEEPASGTPSSPTPNPLDALERLHGADHARVHESIRELAGARLAELSEGEFLRVIELVNREVQIVETTGRLTALLAAIIEAAPRIIRALYAARGAV